MSRPAADRPLSVGIVGAGLVAAAHRAAWESSGERVGVPARVVAVSPMAHEVDDLGPDLLVRCGAAGEPAVVHLGDGRAVVDFWHRCVPAVRLAADTCRAGVIGELRAVTVRGPLTDATVDLVTVLAGDHVALLRPSGPDRVDGLLNAGSVVVIDDASADALHAEVDGSLGSLVVDLRTPLSITVFPRDGDARRVDARPGQHPYPAIFGPPNHPSRLWRAADHLAADAVELLLRDATGPATVDDLARARRALAEAVDRAETGGAGGVPPRAGGARAVART